ncbi:hypothetical protein TSAR_010875 [Trichomalopsis sarcophagae]|uniref:Plastocyanin-like domain-containing protein n=1 Tax=Trichomalopsis sarcophagae TaxID=543379 RepID=A0A232F489_9HYME|nr:hypothetical protein TSAR_010875 [Trichomalopsis sarcophagae]
MDREGKIHRRLEAAPWKDSVIVPSGGYTIVRFYANNPGEDKKHSTKKCIYKRDIFLGYWFLHCHYDQHANDALEAVLNFDDENFFGYEADRIDWSKHPCRRNCTNNGPPMTCQYVFVVEEFSAMSKGCYDCPFNLTDCSRPHCIPVDGFQKTLFVANRQMPGPNVEVCVGDTVMVEVRNLMMSESTTIHWHGIIQKDTPYMDGVPYVTQCPILPNDRFRYVFKVTKSGTYFWHSHIDFHYRSNIAPTAMIINGKGRFQQFIDQNGTVFYTPLEVFTVTKGKRYRIRMIDSGADNCPMEMAIDNHTMRVISLDGNDIQPVNVDTINIWQGERVDFIINANQTVDNYWIRFRGFGLCNTTDPNTSVYQLAILRYEGAKITDPTAPVGYNIMSPKRKPRSLNPNNVGTETRDAISIPLLRSLSPNDVSSTKRPDQQIFISFDFYPINNYDYHRAGLYGFNQALPRSRIGTLQMNNITLHLQAFPLLSQRNQIRESMLCNYTTVKDQPCANHANNAQCACTHVINIKLNSVVELIYLDQGLNGFINHPMHVHGHFFRVVSTENLDGIVTADRIRQLDKKGKIKRNLNRAPFKDTMKTPGGGYTIVRFHANNPGYWFFHCHFEHHVNIGMALVFKIGEHKDMVPVPKDFPKCGTFKM